MKNRSTVKITKDLRLPGTDVILEAGDRIRVLSEAIPQESIVRGFVRDEPNLRPPNQAYKTFGLKPEEMIGWFSNKYSRAAGWTLYKLRDFEKREFGNNAVRAYSEETDSTSIIKFNLLTGTYAFLDNDAYLDGEIKFEAMSKYDKIFIEPTDTAFKEFNII